MGQEKITGNFALDIGQAKHGYFFTLKTANSSLADHYNVLELVQYLSFRLGILTSLTASQKYKLHQLLGQSNFWFWEKVMLTKNCLN